MPDADFTKWPKPEEIARVILFLCGEDAKVIHGAAVPSLETGETSEGSASQPGSVRPTSPSKAAAGRFRQRRNRLLLPAWIVVGIDVVEL
jgi:hypothetical protein